MDSYVYIVWKRIKDKEKVSQGFSSLSHCITYERYFERIE